MTITDIKLATKQFNKSNSFDEFKVNIDLAGISLDEFAETYTEKVAAKWPKFLERFADEDTKMFDLKKFYDYPVQVNLCTHEKGRVKLPYSIKISDDKYIIRYCTALGDRNYRIKFTDEMKEFQNFDYEIEVMNIMLYETIFSFTW